MGKNILIIDDEEVILHSLAIMFKNEGIEVDTESRPIKALERYRGNAYGIVLVDILMPEMRGEEVIRAVKSLNPLCNIIVMTAFSNMTHVVDCIEAGAVDYITKPFVDIGLLLDIVCAAIHRVERWQRSFGIDPKIGLGQTGPVKAPGR
jgi:DNA-binding NtrC family response regulator